MLYLSTENLSLIIHITMVKNLSSTVMQFHTLTNSRFLMLTSGIPDSPRRLNMTSILFMKRKMLKIVMNSFIFFFVAVTAVSTSHKIHMIWSISYGPKYWIGLKWIQQWNAAIMDALNELDDAVDGHSNIRLSKRAISRIGTIGRQFDDQRDEFGNVIDGGTVHYKKWATICNKFEVLWTIW